MKTYKIKVLTSLRKVVEVTVSANDVGSATRQGELKGQVMEVKRVYNVSVGRMSLSDRLVFFQRLASMLAARVSTTEALDIIYQSFNGAVKEAALILKNEIINEGAQLHEAMETAGPRYFPTNIVAIIKTGSSGGDVAYAIREAARFERELAQVRKESSKGLFSALGGFVIGIATILGSTLYVAPQIMGSSFIEATGGADIGWVMTMSNFITIIAIVAAVLVGGFVLLGNILRPLAPAFIDRIILKIPYYRDMVLSKANYMTFFGLAVLLKAGLRVEEALTLTIAAAPRGELRADLERARDALIQGGNTPWPYVMTMLHPTDKAALATAQDREQTASTIEELAYQYKSIYHTRMETFVPAMQAFAAIFLSFAGFVLFGVSIIPLMQSSANVMKML